MFEIKAIDSSLKQTFTDYLEGISFNHSPHWATCYCHFYHNDEPIELWFQRTGEQNKKASLDAIDQGLMKGFLAFEGSKCIGWLNANDASKYIRLKSDLVHYIKNRKVAVTICFVIHPLHRNQGVARKLLIHAVEYYQKLGYDEMIALPSIAKINSDLHYHGSINMYKELGYQVIELKGDTLIMYKKL